MRRASCYNGLMDSRRKAEWMGVWLVVVLGIFAGTFLYWDEYVREKEFVVYEHFEDFLNEERPDEEEIEQYVEDLQEAYRNDTYGGETPQETFELFKEALKAGDTDLAAKYFLVEKQERMRKEFEVGLSNGSMTTFISFLDKAEDGGGSGDSYEFAVTEDAFVTMSFNLVKNPYSGVWKMESL